MSIFGIIGISIGISICVLLICILIAFSIDKECDAKFWAFSLAIMAIVLVGGILLGVGISTTNERIYIARYEVQKQTIEQSLASNMLTGLERVELVNKAIELNGELAEHKAKFNLWHTIYYDNSIYDNVDFIVFE